MRSIRGCVLLLRSCAIFSALLSLCVCVCVVHYLVEFFCDRLKDRVVILPGVLAALQALVSYRSTAGGLIV